MNFLQVATQKVIQDVWAANLITGGVILVVMGWLFKKWWDTVEQRLKAAEEKAEAARGHGETIERNYIKRFEDVHRQMDSNKNQIKDHFTEEIKQVTHEKNNYRQKQAIVTTEIATNQQHMMRTIDEIKNLIAKK